jgi:hypothetical protein
MTTNSLILLNDCQKSTNEFAYAYGDLKLSSNFSIIKQIENISTTILMEELDIIVFSTEDDDSNINDI